MTARFAARLAARFAGIALAAAACGDDTGAGGQGASTSSTGANGTGAGNVGGAGASSPGGGGGGEGAAPSGGGGEGGGLPPTTVNCDAAVGTLPELTLTEVVPYIASPGGAVVAPGEPERLYLINIFGYVQIYDTVTEELIEDVFLNVSSDVYFSGERGLLGLAFHPEYEVNGRFFIHFSQPGTGNTEVAEYARMDRDHANPEKVKTILTQAQPEENHKGGTITFGPDGYLYVFLGDGGGPGAVAHDLGTRLGKILRIDVDDGDPFAGAPGNYPGALPEIWAIGVRNPWRDSIDPCTGDVWIGDVGQGAWEEIDRVHFTDSGLDLGWNVVEGTHCFPAEPCDATGVTMPVHEYIHSPTFGGNASVIGGHVYRGSKIPSARGRYFFGDYITGQVFSFRLDRGIATDLVEHTDQIGLSNMTSFAQDPDGELFVFGQQKAFRVDPVP